MSFVKPKPLMEEGDTVLLYLGFDNLVQVQLARGSTHQNRYGAIKHERLIGAPYGVKLDCPKGWVYPLQATSELWTLALPHRTQILYTPDISMIVMQLGLRPGAVVVEAGTGSGSLSHALIRAVLPTGRLNTFEFHADRCTAATKEFEQHGLADCVTARHRDVCAEGFEPVTEADAVFLDLPAPWDCIGHAKKALISGGRICCFSPCIEQVQRTCQQLTDHGFTDLNTLECLARNFSVQKIKLPSVDFGDQPDTRETNVLTVNPDNQSSEETAAKVCKTSQNRDGNEEGATEDEELKSQTEKEKESSKLAPTKNRQVEKKCEFRTGAPPEVMQGHTGFLTFASLY